jgi:hypothetical protein
MEVGGKRQATTTLAPEKIGHPCTEAWQGPRAGKDWCEKSPPCRGLNHEPPSSLQVVLPNKSSRLIGESSQVNNFMWGNNLFFVGSKYMTY